MTIAGVTVIIISRGLKALLNQCLTNLSSAAKAAGQHLTARVVLVDNASEIPYQLEDFDFDDINLLRFDKDHSFSRANNIAAQTYPNDFFLLLNNDVLLNRNTLTAMLHVLQTIPNAGLCGTRLVFPDGTIQHCGVVFGPGTVGPYQRMRRAPGQLATRTLSEYQAVTGACLLVKKELWNSVGGFDENYPFGLEDIDFCLKARLSGWRVFCDNSTDSLHFESSTPGRVEKDVISRKLFMRKWNGRFTIDG